LHKAKRNGGTAVYNRLLLALAPKIRDGLLAQSSTVDLPTGHLIYPAGGVGEHMYFVNRGLIAMVKTMEDGRSVEVGAVGIENFVGLFAHHHFDHVLVDYVVEIPTQAFRISTAKFYAFLETHETLRAVVKRSRLLAISQLVQNSACNRLHSLEQRCSSWLLIARDNALADNFFLTHEFLAALLGVQRPSLSVTANRLQKRGLIQYVHGQVKILDHAAIEGSACECYRTLSDQIDRAFRL
jgi:CRP-like cAMP-binding protein